MPHFAFQPPGAALVLEVDHCVVGSGAAGATAAVTLARAGKRVALLEAGPWRDPADYPNSVYGAMRDLLAGWCTTFTRGRAYWPIVQGAVVGGSTVVNSAICVRTPGEVLERWQREHGFGGTNAERVLGEIQDELERELSVEKPPAAALGRHNQLALSGATRLGYESDLTLRYVKQCQGQGRCLQGCKAERKQSLNLNYVPDFLERGGTVLSCAPADRVWFRGNEAVGVSGHFKHPRTRRRGARYRIVARSGVLVAASALQSPLLLKRSGVTLSALGKSFRAHPGAPVFGVYDEPVDMNTGVTQGWESLAFRDQGFKLETLSLPLDMFAGRVAGAGPELMARLSEFRQLAMWIHAIRAESVGDIHEGAFHRPVVRYSLNRQDMGRFRAGLVALSRTHFAAGARFVIPNVHGLSYRLAADELGRLENAPLDPRAYLSVISHLFGGCVMGTDASRSVCDARGRVHGHPGLYVVDASIIPTTLGVNPQHTVMALARYFAQQMLSEPSSAQTRRGPPAANGRKAYEETAELHRQAS